MSVERRDLLIEIGCEEIPARMIQGGSEALARAVVAILDKAGIEHGEPQLLFSARRLAVLIPETAIETARETKTLTGPPAGVAWDADGNVTRAGEGWAKKQGITTGDLQRITTDRGEYAGAEITVAARSLAEVLDESLEGALRKISFPKTMRWGTGEHTFVRPVQWLVVLAGDQVQDVGLFGLRADRSTYGHRTLAAGPHDISSPDDYVATLRRAYVAVAPGDRRETLAKSLNEVAREAGGELVADGHLLQESADMVEYPGAISGGFEPKFVEQLPREVLGTCLKHHQKAFMIAAGEKLLPSFAVAVNVPADPNGHVRRGNEWVVGGRLDDALFFWNEDRKRTLADRFTQLAGVVFQRELGSYAAKSRRVAALAKALVEEFDLDVSAAALERAATLSRCDLVSGLVGEFPELQGVAGGLMARADDEPQDVWQAVYDFYRPGGQEGNLPAGAVGRLLGLADRLDTLAGTFAIGLIPSGSRDPFALRRAGFAAVRLAETFEGLDIRRCVAAALRGYDGTHGPDLSAAADEAASKLHAFLFERFAAMSEERGSRYDEIASVRARADSSFVPADLRARLEALGHFRTSEDFLSLAATSKRIRNILGQARERGEIVEAGQHAESLSGEVETQLRTTANGASSEVSRSIGGKNYDEALEALSRLRGPVDRFFDEVMVMDEDPSIRRARLGLLAQLDELTRGVVDLSELVVDG